jgi:hypothetical protein
MGKIKIDMKRTRVTPEVAKKIKDFLEKKRPRFTFLK